MGFRPVTVREPPLNLRREYLSTKFVLKVRSFKSMDNICNNISNLCIQDLTNLFWKKKISPPLADAFSNTATYDGLIYNQCSTELFSYTFDISQYLYT